MNKYKCLRCNHEWFSRRDTMPLACPSCKSYQWKYPKGEKPDE